MLKLVQCFQSCHRSGFLVQVNTSRAGNAAQHLQQKDCKATQKTVKLEKYGMN